MSDPIILYLPDAIVLPSPEVIQMLWFTAGITTSVATSGAFYLYGKENQERLLSAVMLSSLTVLGPIWTLGAAWDIYTDEKKDIVENATEVPDDE